MVKAKRTKGQTMIYKILHKTKNRATLNPQKGGGWIGDDFVRFMSL
jgi:hypothetical protein